MEKKVYLSIEAYQGEDDNSRQESDKVEAFVNPDGKEGFEEVFQFTTAQEIEKYELLEDFACFIADSAPNAFESPFNTLSVIGIRKEDNVFTWGLNVFIDDDDNVSCQVIDWLSVKDNTFQYGSAR